jgi:hypothetical protein
MGLGLIVQSLDMSLYELLQSRKVG